MANGEGLGLESVKRSFFSDCLDSSLLICSVSFLCVSIASSSILAVVEALSTASLVFRKPKMGPKLPLFSTVTKLVLTLEMGRELLLRTLSEPAAGDRPLEGGDACSFFASNMARMLRTPPLPLVDRSAIALESTRLQCVYKSGSSGCQVSMVLYTQGKCIRAPQGVQSQHLA